MAKTAFDLVKTYIKGWKENDLSLITDVLTEDCVVIESHGPTYHGIPEMKLWFKFWLEAKSTVLKWNILSCSFCEKEQAAFCEWDFECVPNNTQYSFCGISFVKFSGEKIKSIHEYRMTHPVYRWGGKVLKSG